jgi:hypothetical protein
VLVVFSSPYAAIRNTRYRAIPQWWKTCTTFKLRLGTEVARFCIVLRMRGTMVGIPPCFITVVLYMPPGFVLLLIRALSARLQRHAPMYKRSYDMCRPRWEFVESWAGLIASSVHIWG